MHRQEQGNSLHEDGSIKPTLEKPCHPFDVGVYKCIYRLPGRRGLKLVSLADEAIINAARGKAFGLWGSRFLHSPGPTA